MGRDADISAPVRSAAASLSGARTLCEMLTARAQMHPDRVLYRYVESANPDAAARALTFGELQARAQQRARLLRETAREGSTVLLIYPAGLDFIISFYACLYAGLIAVPAPPAMPGRLQRMFPRLTAIARDCKPSLALANAKLANLVKSGLADSQFGLDAALAGVRWIATSEDEELSAAGGQALAGNSEIAFLQYTSGSTADPKGVCITHANLIYGLANNAVEAAFAHDSVTVSWVPNFHDLGLVFGVLQPLYVGGEGIFLSPDAFMRRPAFWLETISRFRASHSSTPNFGLEHALRRVTDRELQEIDLSSWVVAVIGGEPVRANTIERFAARFAPCGLRYPTLSACYGMAEAVLKVSSTTTRGADICEFDAAALRQGSVHAPIPGKDTRRLVACGWIGPGTRVEIVDPETGRRCLPDRVGEIWVKSPSIAAGYWQRPKITASAFQARLPDGDGPFYRTGDLGFIWTDQLIPCGRLKDLVIVRGLNYYPQDIEEAVENAHPIMRAGRSAAFSTDGETEEKLVVVAEVRGSPSNFGEAIAAIRRTVVDQVGLHVARVVLIASGSLPKTSSGKLQRAATRTALEAGALPVLLDWTLADLVGDRSSLVDYLMKQLSEELSRRGVLDDSEALNPDRSPIELGVDSLMAVELLNSIRDELGIRISAIALAEAHSVKELAAAIAAQPSRQDEDSSDVTSFTDEAVDRMLHELMKDDRA
ncbi:MAG: AMP-binding protein [Rhizomicrobium sp.]